MKAKKSASIGFDDFREMARDSRLSVHGKIGFDDSVRQGQGRQILNDICHKLSAFQVSGSTIVDIGAGCGELAQLLTETCEAAGRRLIRVDSAEMLEQAPRAKCATDLPGRFPEVPGLFENWSGKADAVVVYSVLQYVFAEGNLFDFVDRATQLLKPGGEILLGDIPNASSRRRFLESETGRASHRQRFGDSPLRIPDAVSEREIDDGVVLCLLSRYRSAGFETFLLPQPPVLPMSNRREDILIRRR